MAETVFCRLAACAFFFSLARDLLKSADLDISKLLARLLKARGVTNKYSSVMTLVRMHGISTQNTADAGKGDKPKV